MLFSFQLPTLSTDEETPSDIEKIEIYRLKEPRVLPEARNHKRKRKPRRRRRPRSQTKRQSNAAIAATTANSHANTDAEPATNHQTSPQTQTQTAPQTQTQTAAAAHVEEAREIDEAEFKDRSEVIAELDADQIDGYIREGYFYYVENVNLQPESEDLLNWNYYGVKFYNKKGKGSGI